MGYDDWKTTEPDACDPGRLRDEQERDAPPLCDECGNTIGVGAVSLAGVGLFCGRRCANVASLKHGAQMRRRQSA